MNYLARFLPDEKADVIFVGYQARGTLGHNIQKYGARENGYVFIDDKKVIVNAGIHSLSGYSAHADQTGLINFVKPMRHKPKHIKIIHGDDEAKQALAVKYRKLLPDAKIEIAVES
jgi:metallo-beta-lactamase family protein